MQYIQQVGKGVVNTDTLFFVDNGIGGGVWWLSRLETQTRTVNVPSDAFFMPEICGGAADILKKPT